MNSETIWLTLINSALGLAVLVCLFVFSRAVVQELRHRAEERRRLASASASSNLDLTSLGITLPDGGEPINEMKRFPTKTDHPDDPPNIVRSDD